MGKIMDRFRKRVRERRKRRSERREKRKNNRHKRRMERLNAKRDFKLARQDKRLSKGFYGTKRLKIEERNSTKRNRANERFGFKSKKAEGKWNAFQTAYANGIDPRAGLAKSIFGGASQLAGSIGGAITGGGIGRHIGGGTTNSSINQTPYTYTSSTPNVNSGYKFLEKSNSNSRRNHCGIYDDD